MPEQTLAPPADNLADDPLGNLIRSIERGEQRLAIASRLVAEAEAIIESAEHVLGAVDADELRAIKALSASREGEFVRALERLTSARDRLLGTHTAALQDDLSAREAASRLGLARPDGTPQDSFYATVAPELVKLGAYRIAGNKLRVPHETLERFKKKGGAR